MSLREKLRKRWVRRTVIATLVLAALLTALIAVLRIRFHGDNLASFVETTINGQIRGKVSVGHVDWPISALPGAVAGGWLPVTLTDIEVWDEHGKLVLRADKATGEIETMALALGPDFHFRNIVIHDVPREDGKPSAYALIREVRQSLPAYEGDRTVVSLVSAFYPKHSPAFRAGMTASSSPVFDLQSFRVEGVALDFDFGEAFRAQARGVTGEGFLRSDPRDPLSRKLYYSLAPRVSEASVQAGPLDLRVRDLEIERLAQIAEGWPRTLEPTSLRWKASGRTASGATIALQGAMLDHWSSFYGGDYDIRLEIQDAGPMASALSSGLAGGSEVAAVVEINGPTVAPTLSVSTRNLELSPRVGERTVPILLDSASAQFDLATDSGALRDTVASVGGGQVRLGARLSLNPLSFDVDLDVPEPVDLSVIDLPPELTRLTGEPVLSGTLHASGTRDLQELDQLDLEIGRLGVTGRVYRRALDGVIEVQRLGLTLGRTNVDVTGNVYTADGVYDLQINGASRDLSRWLRIFRAPAVATSASGSAHVTGTFDNPTVNAALSAGGVPLVGKASTRLSYQAGDLRVERLRSSALGGKLQGKARIRLGGRPYIVSASAQGENLDLSKFPVVGEALTGQAQIAVKARGPARAPRAQVDLDLSNWTLMGEQYDDTQLVGRAEEDGSKSVEVHLARQRGGKLDLAAFLSNTGGLGGVVSMRKLPIETLTHLGNTDEPIFGAAVDAELQLSGRLDEPTADGHVSLTESWFASSFLGNASLDLVALPDGRLGFAGRFFQDSIVLEGALSTVPPFEVELEADMRRVEIDRFWPEMREQWDARGWMSGKLAYRATLLPVPGRKAEIDLELTEAMLIVDSENARGRPAPIRLQTRSPLSLAVVGDRFDIKNKVTIEGPAGDFTLSGGGTLGALGLTVDGTVSIALLKPYFQAQFEDLAGTVRARAMIAGSFDNPRLSGSVLIDKVAIKPVGQDTTVRVPSGKIEFTNDQLSLTGLSMVVQDDYSKERSELTISGGVKLADFQPRLWAIQIDGQLAGKMLLVVAPESFSAARGVADLSIALSGPGRTPDIDGRIEFADDNPLSLVPRALRRELTLTSGALIFTEQLVELEDIQGWLDDEGRITKVTGEIGLQDWRPVDGCVSLSATEVPFRVPETLELALNIRNVSVCGDRVRGVEIGGGRIEIIDGRYVQRWKQAVDFIKVDRTPESSPGILETEPLLANAKLDNLRVSTRAFFVKNNVANLELSGDLTITGTPADPRLDGLVRVEQGTFKVQLIRPTFTRTTGSLWFSKLKDFPEQSPRIEVRSESDYRDTTGQDHLIILELSGSLSNLRWDLKTGAGLNKQQTISLALAGRNLDELRTTLEGRGNQEVIPKAGEFAGVRSTEQIDSGGLALADEFAKSLSGDLLSSLVSDPIRNLTNIDVVRLRLGATGTINLYLEENITRSLRGSGEYERSSRGSTLTGRVRYRITDRISGDWEYLRKQYDDDAEVGIARQRIKFTYRLPIIP